MLFCSFRVQSLATRPRCAQVFTQPPTPGSSLQVKVDHLPTCRCRSSPPEEPAPAAASWWSAEEAWTSRTTSADKKRSHMTWSWTQLSRKNPPSPSPGWRSKLQPTRRWTLDSSTSPPPDDTKRRSESRRTERVRWEGCGTWWFLSELDSASPASLSSVDGGGATATIVPSSLTWDFSVILSIPKTNNTCCFCPPGTAGW